MILVGLLSFAVSANAAVTRNVSTYGSIQATINASSAGDTIVMDSPSYSENITIDRRVILKGAGSGSTTINSAALNTPVITLLVGGTSATDRLVIQDVTIKGASSSISEHLGSGITLLPGVDGYLTFSDVTVIENSGNGIDINLFDLLRDIVIRNSTLAKNGGSGFRSPESCLGIDGLEIADSHFDSNSGGGFTAYGFTLTNWNVHNSTFNDNVGIGYGMYIQGHMVDMKIDCSQFNHNIGDTSSGLILFPAAVGDVYSNITIKSSQFKDNPLYGISVQPELGTFMQNISLECDAFEHNGIGIVIFDPGVITGFSVHNSNFVGNTIAGLENDNAAGIDAKSNWWGDLNGPNVNGMGPGAGNAIINGPGSGPVDFVPFLTAPSPCVATCGPAIKIVKKTNGTDNDLPTGPIVAVGSTVTWTYEVTNTGNVPLTSVAVTDNKIGAIGCPVNSLAIGESMTCTAMGAALADQYTNIGSVIGTPPTGPNVMASNPDNYFGSAPAITLVKKTNGTDNNAPTGPIVTVGSTVTWTYEVKNTGNVPLTNVTLTDDKIGVINTCPATSLAVGASMTCTKTGTALAGQYTNIGTATGTPPVGSTVTATDPDNYFGQTPPQCVATTFNFTGGNSSTSGGAGNIRTFTAGGVSVHASAFGETKPSGTHVFSPAYLGHYSLGLGVTDSSENGASNTHVVDNYGQNNYVMLEFSQSVVVDRAYLDYIVGDSDVRVWIGTIPNAYNVHQNLNAALLTSLGFTEVNLGANAARWADVNAGLLSGNVFVIAAKTDETDDGFKLSKLETACPGPGISIVKKTNGTDNNVAPGLTVAVGSTVTWTYLVTNTGNVALSPVTVTDDKVVGTICTVATLAPGASTTCTKTGTAVAGQYTNIGTATGKPPTGLNVTATNPDNYYGSAPGISILKKTNYTNNDAAPGPTVAVGSTVTWTYLVTNTGNVPLTNVAVTDNKVGAISCPYTTLAAGATGSMTCTKTGTAVAGQYTNIGTVTGTPPVGSSVTASNPDNYFGVAPCPATGTISFAGSTATSGTAGNVKTFSVGTVNVHASAFSRVRSGGTWNTAYLGSYSGGLGVTDGSEGSGSNDTHKIDNIGGRDNYVLLEFSTAVVIDKAFLDVVGADSDVSVWIGTKTNPYTTHGTLSDSILSGFYMEENSTADVTPGSRWADLNVTQKSGNVVVIAALASDSSPEDAFKLSKVELGCPPPPVCSASTFIFSGNTATSGTAGNMRTFAVNGVTVNVSAFSRADSGGAWAPAYLGLYSGGLGVTDTSEGTGSNNTHKVDNGGGRNNYVLFEFSAPVVIDQAYLDIIGADSDISTWIGTAPDPINNHLILSDALLSYGIREDNAGSNVPRWANINAGNVPANVLVISGLMGDTAYNDAFKISKLDVKCH